MRIDIKRAEINTQLRIEFNQIHQGQIYLGRHYLGRLISSAAGFSTRM